MMLSRPLSDDVFELRHATKNGQLVVFEPISQPINLSLPQASLHTDALPDVRFAPDRRNYCGARASLLAFP